MSKPVKASEVKSRKPQTVEEVAKLWDESVERTVARLSGQAAQAIRGWPQAVVDAGVKLDDGRAYRPQGRNVGILRHVDDPKRLIAEAKHVLNLPIDEFEEGRSGWDRICAQAGVELTWEWTLVDPDAPWAVLFTNAERQRVVNAGRAA